MPQHTRPGDVLADRYRLTDLLTTAHSALRDLAEVITATQLALPGGTQPLWGGDERRTLP